MKFIPCLLLGILAWVPCVRADVALENRFDAAWARRKGEAYRERPVRPPVFRGHPRFARPYSENIAHFVLRVFHNGETNFYALANQKFAENSCFYHANKDVRNDRDSFYWNIGEFCRVLLHYGKVGDRAPGRVSSDAEAAFCEMALSYCHDMSKLEDAKSDPASTWRVYESENHHVQRDSALWQLMHVLLKYDPKYGEAVMGDGATLRAHYAAWGAFFRTWMRERARKSMFIEVQSRVYGTHTIKNIYPFYDFAPDAETRRLAKNFIDLFWALWAQEQIAGASGGGMSRIYPTSARGTRTEAMSWAYWYFGTASRELRSRKPSGMDYVCLDSSYRPSPLVQKLAQAAPTARGVYEIESRPLGWTLPTDRYPNYRPDPSWGRIYRYSYCTPEFILGTQMFPEAPAKNWCLISSQNRFQGAVFGGTDVQLLPIPAAGGVNGLYQKEPDISFNPFWSMQKGGTLITRRNRYAVKTGAMRVWFSAAGGLDKVSVEDGWYFTRTAGAYAAVRVVAGKAEFRAAGPKKPDSPKDLLPCEREGHFLVCADLETPVILEVARACDFPDEQAFRTRVKALKPNLTAEALDYTGLSGHAFHMVLAKGGASTIDGVPYVKKIDWSFKSPFVEGKWNDDKVVLRWGAETDVLDFSERRAE